MPIQKKGYDLLKNFSDQYSNKNDSLVTNISQLYTVFIDMIENSNEFVKNDVLNNLNHLKTKSWFVDWTQQKFSKEMIIYFAESEDYRIRVAAHNILAAQNHLRFIQTYKAQATEVLKRLNTRFETNEGGAKKKEALEVEA